MNAGPTPGEAATGLLLVLAFGWALRERMSRFEMTDQRDGARKELFLAWEQNGELKQRLAAAEEVIQRKVAAELS